MLDTSRGIARTQWCVGGRMNIVHNCLDKWMGTAVEHRPALHWEGEEGTTRTMTYGQLRQEVHRCANGLRRMGIGRGDRVALFMPMCPELVAAFFAVITVGGIVLPLFSGYGADAVASRLAGLRRKGACSPPTVSGGADRSCAMKATADQAVALVAVRAARDRRLAARRRDVDDRPRLPMVRSRRLRVRHCAYRRRPTPTSR